MSDGSGWALDCDLCGEPLATIYPNGVMRAVKGPNPVEEALPILLRAIERDDDRRDAKASKGVRLALLRGDIRGAADILSEAVEAEAR
jgi:hypothetical protein